MRVGLCSVAHLHAHAYAAVLADLPGATLAGVADADETRGREFARAHGTEFVPAEPLLDRCDAAIVCAPNARHRSWVERAVDAGVGILCEKPLATTTADAVAMAERCDAAGVPLGVAMPLRFSPPAVRARERLSEIGELQFVSGWNRGRMPGDWFVDPDAAGGGAVQDHTVHLVNLVRWLTGREVAEVHAEVASGLHAIDVEDVNVLSMALDDGTPFTLDGSWSRPDSWPNWGDAGAELVGTDGVIAFEHTAQTVRLTSEDGDPPVRAIDWGTDANEGLIRDFLEAVRTGGDPETTAVDGSREVAVVEAAYESARRERPVSVSRPL